ncbi:MULTISPECIES: MFS transporter [Bifidobacterium]|uniref:MFS transporter n=1 Tax=Bifidobacterium apousia TaxID=2750996 RepID=A0A556R1H3_9BIFI|nr:MULTISPECIES: MFS transporter [Bifidobacterium]MBI0136179.1 hypothetical protein [Bifidobacterium sp. W8120]TSJ82711.1 MFS transporter [Bifidobacterium apousia]
MTRWAGSLTNRPGPHVVVIGCLIAAAIGAAILLIDIGNPVLCVTGLAVFDASCFGSQTADQVAVVSIDPPQSDNYSSVYLTLYFATGAIDSSLVTPILSIWGWTGVALVGVVLPAAGALIQLLSRRLKSLIR